MPPCSIPIVLSREAVVLIAKHAWHADSSRRRAYGLLAGVTGFPDQVIAVLPVAQVMRWSEIDMRWLVAFTPISRVAQVMRWSEIDMAHHTSRLRTSAESMLRLFGLCVIGSYMGASPFMKEEDFSEWLSFPLASEGIHVRYEVECCRGCSDFNVWRYGERLQRDEDWKVSSGKKTDPEFSQRRLLSCWNGLLARPSYLHSMPQDPC
jgi:hypothetical protein